MSSIEVLTADSVLAALQGIHDRLERLEQPNPPPNEGGDETVEPADPEDVAGIRADLTELHDTLEQQQAQLGSLQEALPNAVATAMEARAAATEALSAAMRALFMEPVSDAGEAVTITAEMHGTYRNNWRGAPYRLERSVEVGTTVVLFNADQHERMPLEFGVGVIVRGSSGRFVPPERGVTVIKAGGRHWHVWGELE